MRESGILRVFRPWRGRFLGFFFFNMRDWVSLGFFIVERGLLGGSKPWKRKRERVIFMYFFGWFFGMKPLWNIAYTKRVIVGVRKEVR